MPRFIAAAESSAASFTLEASSAEAAAHEAIERLGWTTDLTLDDEDDNLAYLEVELDSGVASFTVEGEPDGLYTEALSNIGWRIDNG